MVDLEKAEEAEIKLPKSIGSQKNQENFKETKTIGFCFIEYSKAFDCVDDNLSHDKPVCRPRRHS